MCYVRGDKQLKKKKRYFIMVTIKEFRTLQKKIRILKNLKRDLNTYEDFLTMGEKMALNTSISIFEIDCKSSINKMNKELLKEIK